MKKINTIQEIAILSEAQQKEIKGGAPVGQKAMRRGPRPGPRTGGPADDSGFDSFLEV